MQHATSHPADILSLATTVHKNLAHQADWTDVQIHSSPTLPRPLISGVPPEAIYVDPDSEDSEDGRKVEREWVLPVDLRETWTVRQWAEVFDSIPAAGEEDEDGGVRLEGNTLEMGQGRKRKRVVMGIVSGDSTVVYYIVHDGIVKPRQN